MSILGGNPRMPGLYSGPSSTPRTVFKGDPSWYMPGGRVLDGSQSRDPGNDPDVHVLRAGLLLGKRTANSKYAPSIIGVSTAAIAATATTINVSPAQAVEIVRRVGATGTLRFVGPPTAAGTVATFTETYSAVNTTTGDITIAAADAALIAGSFVCANDGSYLPLSFVTDGFGLRVTDPNGTSMDVPIARLPIGGVVRADMLLPVWPSDASLRDWVRDQLKKNGDFELDYAF